MNKRFLLMTFAALAALLVCPQQVAAEDTTDYFDWDNLASFWDVTTAPTWTTDNLDGACKFTFTSEGSQVGWEYSTAIDLSSYDYLTINLAEYVDGIQIRLYDGTVTYIYNINSASYKADLYGTPAEIDGSGTLDLTKIKKIYFWRWSGTTFTVNSIGLSNATDFTRSTTDGTLEMNLETLSMNIYGSGIYSYSSGVGSLTNSSYGFGGWQISEGLNLSDYDYAVIELSEAQSNGASFRMFDVNNYWTSCASYNLDETNTTFTIPLSTLTKSSTTTVDGTTTTTTTGIDLSHIYIIGFWSYGSESPSTTTNSSETVKIKSVKFTKDSGSSESQTVTVSSMGYATYCSDYNLDFSEITNIKPYTAKVNTTNSTLELNEITDGHVPANTGVILYSASGAATVSVPTVSETSGWTSTSLNSDLTGVTSKTTIESTDYILNQVSDVVGFYQAGNYTTLGANKAYLPSDKVNTTETESKGLSIVFGGDDGTTGISTVATSEANSTVKTIYNLAGQRLSAPQKGLNIINGKKVIIK